MRSENPGSPGRPWEGDSVASAASIIGPVRVLVVLGTRPEAIKLTPVVEQLAEHPGVESRVLVTAQHRQLLDQVLHLFGVRPAYDLDLMRSRQDLAGLTADVLKGVSRVLCEWRPHWVVVQGDTTTAMAASLAGFYERVAVAHVEAGLRTGDLYAPWPEEMNRRVTGLVTEAHFAPTARARANLLAEGVPPERVWVTGNTGIDTLLKAAARISADACLRARLEACVGIPAPGMRRVLVTGHRRESFGEGFESICRALRRLAERGDVEVLYPVHLNPNVQEPVQRILGGHPHVRLMEPLGYFPFVYAMCCSELIITDSGGVQEEAPSLGKPVLVMRETTERAEGVEAGTTRLVGTDEGRIVETATELLDDAAAYERMARIHNPYGDGRAAERVVAVLAGAAALAGSAAE
jgi:UDP-N-acetylglucosamine 2-epimerase (non-hydrolysing)